MTAITLTQTDQVPIPGLKKGKWSAQDGYTSKFGFRTLKGVTCTVDDDSDVIVTATISSGSATINFIEAGGSAPAGTVTGYYIAWGE